MDSCSDREILGTHTVAAGESSWKIYNGVETNGLTRKLSVMLLNFPGFSGGGCTDSLGQGQAGDKGSKRVASNGIQTGFERKLARPPKREGGSGANGQPNRSDCLPTPPPRKLRKCSEVP